MKTPEELYPDVQPVMGRVLCYHVKSRSEDEPRFVDWVDGYCTCPDYHKTHKLRESKTREPYVCYHMQRAMGYGWEVNREIARTTNAPVHHHQPEVGLLKHQLARNT